MQIRKGGTWRSTTSAQAYINGAWRQILYGKCFKSGAWRDVCNFTVTPTPTPTPTPTFSMTISPTSFVSVSGRANTSSPVLTATPSGGASPYTYLWTVVQSDGPVTFTASTSASTQAVAAGAPLDTSWNATLKCTCSDRTGLTGTATVSGTFQRDPIFGGGFL